MIFLTVGAQFGFDRLVRAVDASVEAGIITEPVFAQVGDGKYRPRNFPSTQILASGQYQDQFSTSQAVIGHAGMGTIMMALKLGKPLLAMPRLKQFGEVVNDHQVAICKKFAADGFILPAFNEKELQTRIKMLADFTPVRRIPQPEKVFNRIKEFLEEYSRDLLNE